MPYSLDTQVAIRVLDAKIARHQYPDTIGSHLLAIEGSVAAIPVVNLSPVLTAITAIPPVDHTLVLAALAQLDQKLTLITTQQQLDSAKVEYLFGILKSLAAVPVPQV